MEIKLELFELKNICMDMAELGAAASEKKRSPASDKITQREARKWIKNMGYAPGFLDSLEDAGLVKKNRNGPAKNSPWMYSKFEIQSAINSIKMNGYINKININKNGGQKG